MKKSLTAQCLTALLLGLLVGIVASNLQLFALDPSVSVADAVIRVWTNALRLVVTPLVVAQVFVAVSGPRGEKGDATRLGLVTPVVFVGLLVFIALLSMASMAALLRLPVLSGMPAVDSGVAATTAAADGGGNGAPGAWLDQLVPSNLFAAASGDSLIALMLFALAFGLAARRIAPESRVALNRGFTAVRDAMFVLVGWLTSLAPVTIFALAYRSAISSGLAMGRILLTFSALSIVIMLICTAALYPVTALLGRVSLRRLAKALFPAQATGVATRSSLAAVPALLREAETTLKLPTKVSALVIPLGGAVLKPSRLSGSPSKLVFLTTLLALPLGIEQAVVFVLIVLMMSPTNPGIPKVNTGMRTMAAYVSVGVPPAYVVMLSSSLALTDLFATLLNVTSYLSAAVLVARFGGLRLEEPGVGPATSAAELPKRGWRLPRRRRVTHETQAAP